MSGKLNPGFNSQVHDTFIFPPNPSSATSAEWESHKLLWSSEDWANRIHNKYASSPSNHEENPIQSERRRGRNIGTGYVWSILSILACYICAGFSTWILYKFVHMHTMCSSMKVCLLRATVGDSSASGVSISGFSWTGYLSKSFKTGRDIREIGRVGCYTSNSGYERHMKLLHCVCIYNIYNYAYTGSIKQID